MTTTRRRSARSSSIASGDLREHLTRDLGTLLRVAPGLADIIFGRFAQSDWPQRFINGGQEVDWPKSAAWAMRIVTDAKLQRLVARLLRARSRRPEGHRLLAVHRHARVPRLGAARGARARTQRVEDGAARPVHGRGAHRVEGRRARPHRAHRRRQRRDRRARRGHPRLRAILPARSFAPAPRPARRRSNSSSSTRCGSTAGRRR
jgi:hypothetical protein